MFKNAYFLATEALAGLLCNARLDHTYRPLPGRALDKAGQVRDAGRGTTGDLFEIEVDAVERDKGRPLDVTLIPLNLIGCGNDINGHKSGGHSVAPERVKGASAKRHGQSAAEQNGVEEVNHSVDLEKLDDAEHAEAHEEDSAKADEHEVEGGHSGPCSCGGGELRPDRLPVIGAQLLQSCGRIDFVEPTRKRGACESQAFPDLVQVLLVDFKQGGDFTASLGAVSWNGHRQILVIC